MMDVYYQMAQQLQTEEQEQLSIEEKSKLFVQILEARKKHFASLRAKEKRSKPPTKTQKRKIMSTYLKNIEDKQVEAEVDNDQREVEMKTYIKIIPDDDIAIDAIPLATKPPIIVDWKIIKEEKINSYHLIRVDESSKRYSSMIQMLQRIDREDMETL
nr:hypothetical protein [Tanacetum cinerariifolium]